MLCRFAQKNDPPSVGSARTLTTLRGDWWPRRSQAGAVAIATPRNRGYMGTGSFCGTSETTVNKQKQEDADETNTASERPRSENEASRKTLGRLALPLGSSRSSRGGHARRRHGAPGRYPAWIFVTVSSLVLTIPDASAINGKARAGGSQRRTRQWVWCRAMWCQRALSEPPDSTPPHPDQGRGKGSHTKSRATNNSVYAPTHVKPSPLIAGPSSMVSATNADAGDWL